MTLPPHSPMPRDAAEREQLLGQIVSAIHAHRATASARFFSVSMDRNEPPRSACAPHDLKPGALFREIRLDAYRRPSLGLGVQDAARRVGFAVRHFAKLLKEQAEPPPTSAPTPAPPA